MLLKKCSPHSISERRVPELIPVLGSQPAGDVSHKRGSRLSLLSARPAVTLTTLERATTNLAAWWTEARWVWTACLRLMCNRLRASCYEVPPVIGVNNKLDHWRVLLTTQSTYHGDIFQVQSLGQNSRQQYPYFRRCLNFLITQCRSGGKKLPRQKVQLVTDRQTDRQTQGKHGVVQ